MTEALPLRRAVPALETRRVDVLAGAFTGGGFPLIVIGGLGAAEGGYFPTAWAWAGIGLAWALGLALLTRDVAVTRLELVYIGFAVAFAAWSISSLLWSTSDARTVEEAQRTVLVLLAPAAGVVFAARRGPATFVAGLCAAVTTIGVYALLTRLVPDRVGVYDPLAGYRLSEPLGYWNALGILTVIGMLATAALAAAAPRARFVAGGAFPLLALCLYFTYSRGAWIALAVGVCAALILDGRAYRTAAVFLCAAVPTAILVAIASRADALTHARSALPDAVRHGHEVLLVALGISAATGAIVLFAGGRRRTGIIGVGVAETAVVTAAVALVLQFGSPLAWPQRAWDAFAAPPRVSSSLNQRLFNLSGNGRVPQWEVAWSQAEERPHIGFGAGSFEQRWLRDREIPGKVRDAHSLYLETLAELGFVGLALLLAMLLVPVYAAVEARRHPIVPGAFGAYAAYLVHAGVDWDWEMPAVTLAAIFVGAAILVAARGESRPRPLGRGPRAAALVPTVALIVVSFIGLVGVLAVSQSANAARDGQWSRSLAHAQTAKAWAPWSPEPHRRIGEAELGLGHPERARVSFRAAVEKAPLDWALWFDLARASTGEERRRALAEASRLNPLSPEIARLRLELRAEGTEP